MRFYLLCDAGINAAQIIQSIEDEACIDGASHLSTSREECQAMLDEPAVYASEGQQIVEFDHVMDEDDICDIIF